MGRHLRLNPTRHQLLLAAVTGAVSVIAATALIAAKFAPSHDETAIQDVVLGAIVAEHTLEIPPQSYHGGRMPVGISQEMLARVPSQLQQYYAAGALTRSVSTIQHSIRADVTGKVRYLGGGVDSINYTAISISGDTALVTAEAITWNRVGQDQSGKLAIATPRGPVDYTFALEKVNGRWLINSESFTFPPGTGP